jgi:hypothetical protein
VSGIGGARRRWLPEIARRDDWTHAACDFVVFRQMMPATYVG